MGSDSWDRRKPTAEIDRGVLDELAARSVRASTEPAREERPTSAIRPDELRALVGRTALRDDEPPRARGSSAEVGASPVVQGAAGGVAAETGAATAAKAAAAPATAVAPATAAAPAKATAAATTVAAPDTAAAAAVAADPAPAAHPRLAPGPVIIVALVIVTIVIALVTR